MSAPQTLFQRLAAHAMVRPDAPALSGTSQSGKPQSWTYASLCDDAERLAASMVSLGLAPGDRIAIVSSNSPMMAVAWLAAARCGVLASLVNCNLLKPELAQLMSHLQPGAVLVDGLRHRPVSEALSEIALTCPIILDGDTSAVNGPVLALGDLLTAEPLVGREPRPDDPLFIAFTSGSTARPKAVVTTNRAELYTLDWVSQLAGLKQDDISLSVTPLFHVSGMRNTLVQMWSVGGHAVVADRFSPSGFWRQVAEVGATYTTLVETMLLMLEGQQPTETDGTNSMRVVLGAGPQALIERVERRFDLRVFQVYGMTEIGVATAVPVALPPEALSDYRSYAPTASFSGWGIGTTEIRVVDKAGEEVAEGAVGEIWARAENLFQGYFGDDAATQAAVIDGWLHTGDLALVGPERSVYYVDRSKEMIRRGGENIAPKEIEEALNNHPEVLQAIVFPVPDPIWIEEVKAIVVRQPGSTVGSAELFEWCAHRLAAFKVPRYLEFRDEVPRTPSNRPIKALLSAEGVAGEGEVFDRSASS